MEEFCDKFPSECNYYGIKCPPISHIQTCAVIADKLNLNLEQFFEQWLSFSFTSQENGIDDESLKGFEKYVLNQTKTNKKDDSKIDKIVESYMELESSEKKKRLRSDDEDGNETKRSKDTNTRNTSSVVVEEKTLPDITKISIESKEFEYKIEEFCSRRDAKKVLCTFCTNNEISKIKTFENSENVVKVNVEALVKSKQWFELMNFIEDPMMHHEVATGLKIERIGKELIKINQLDNIVQCISIPYKPEVGVVYGQVAKNKKEKIDMSSICLESSKELGDGGTMHIECTNLEHDTPIFPGQVVAIQASKGAKGAIGAIHVYFDLKLPLPQKLPDFDFQEPLQVVMAAGPFSMKNNIKYEPLTELMAYVHEHRPHVLLLLGPFLEDDHKPFITNELYETHFENVLKGLMQNLKEDNLDTQVVVMSSYRDVHNGWIYPTPPYKLNKDINFSNLHLVPDPCLIDINGLVIGMTSTDILYYLSQQEALLYSSKNANQELRTYKMNRCIRHILSQGNFFPLSSCRAFIYNHESAAHNCMFDVKPHVLVLPSQLQHFVKDIDDCIVINPQKITRMASAGTFARFELHHDYLHTNERSMKNNIVCQVLNI